MWGAAPHFSCYKDCQKEEKYKEEKYRISKNRSIYLLFIFAAYLYLVSIRYLYLILHVVNEFGCKIYRFDKAPVEEQLFLI